MAVIGVNTWDVLVFALADFENVVLGLVGCVVGTADTVECVLAETGGVVGGSIGVADFDAERASAHEAKM